MAVTQKGGKAKGIKGAGASLVFALLSIFVSTFLERVRGTDPTNGETAEDFDALCGLFLETEAAKEALWGIGKAITEESERQQRIMMQIAGVLWKAQHDRPVIKTFLAAANKSHACGLRLVTGKAQRGVSRINATVLTHITEMARLAQYGKAPDGTAMKEPQSQQDTTCAHKLGSNQANAEAFALTKEKNNDDLAHAMIMMCNAHTVADACGGNTNNGNCGCSKHTWSYERSDAWTTIKRTGTGIEEARKSNTHYTNSRKVAKAACTGNLTHNAKDHPENGT
ncbi:hypothetical protein ERJ75_001149200 [Trypanosoma vivax]|nr:hypothetical protein ERJ75_001149200 [Trypanosoma vivax]